MFGMAASRYGSILASAATAGIASCKAATRDATIRVAAGTAATALIPSGTAATRVATIRVADSTAAVLSFQCCVHALTDHFLTQGSMAM